MTLLTVPSLALFAVDSLPLGTDWYAVGGVIASILASVFTAMGVGAKFLADRMDRINEQQLKHEIDVTGKQREHELAVICKIETIVTKFDSLVKEERQERRDVTNTLVTLQRETVQTMAALSQRVGELGATLQEIVQPQDVKD